MVGLRLSLASRPGSLKEEEGFAVLPEIFSVQAVVFRKNPHLGARSAGKNSDAVAVFPAVIRCSCSLNAALCDRTLLPS
jgi:hypothetical protein